MCHSYNIGAYMPTQAARPCNKQGCNGLVRNGECSKCGSQRRQKDKQYDQHRGTAAQRGYGSNWGKLRRMQLASQPLCEECKRLGRTRLATEVHHKHKRRDGGEDSFENFESLCKSCHSRITAQGG